MTMDFLRRFIETAFYHYDSPLCNRTVNVCRNLLDRRTFQSVMRKAHPELSDDSISLIFKAYKERWAKHPLFQDKNLFYTLVHFCNQVLSLGTGSSPTVRFEMLFKWKEVTELIGETLPVCAFIAYKNSLNAKQNIREPQFNWVNVLPTDNKHLSHIFKRNGLIDLHQHLKASTSVFGISWVCLMNSILHRQKQFMQIFGDKERAIYFYNAVTLAAKIRLEIYRCIVATCRNRNNDIDLAVAQFMQKDIALQRKNLHFDIDFAINTTKQRQKCYVYDYAANNDSPMAVYNGERRILYSALIHIYTGDKQHISGLLYRYLLVKTKLRAEMVQLNKNVGFGNFSRYEHRKEIFIEGKKRYEDLLITLPLYEAKRYYQDEIETRIAPKDKYRNLRTKYNEIGRQNEVNNTLKSTHHIIYHFIKKYERDKIWICPNIRNYHVRNEVRQQANAIIKLLNKPSVHNIVGIDAANSEFYCRPEVFSPAFRLLSVCPCISRTFHVGEDFYDIADGLRAIDEAISFLELQRGDRLGHCIALGIHPQMYYKAHEYHVIIPRQVLLDDLVWLKMKAMEWNIVMPPSVEWKIMNVFNRYPTLTNYANMYEYYASMSLRREDPREYFRNKLSLTKAEELYSRYHYNPYVRIEGSMVTDFQVDKEYVAFIESMQEQLMKVIEEKQLVIECCPTSNVKIGRLIQYANHPIFRFNSIKKDGDHHLPVTVNTDDLGIFHTSLPREFELLCLAMLKIKDTQGELVYQQQEIYDWIEQMVDNAHIYKFIRSENPIVGDIKS